jgi:hypothetical protein
MLIATVIRTLIQRGDYKELRDYHDLMRIACAHSLRNDNPDHFNILRGCLLYAEKYGKYLFLPTC